jgi:hypothetical protein
LGANEIPADGAFEFRGAAEGAAEPTPATTTAEEGACLGQCGLVDVDLDFGAVAPLLDLLDLFLGLGGVGGYLDLSVGQLAIDFLLPPLGRASYVVVNSEEGAFDPVRDLRCLRELKAL